MGLLQQGYETYCAMETSRMGKYIDGEKEPLAPVSHLITAAQLEITLDEEGNFRRAVEVDKSEPKIIIPVTEESAGRTSAPCAHPLCDQLSYLAEYDPKKHQLYVDQLTQWAESEYSHPKLMPILTYVKGGSILQDLENAGLVKLNEKGIPDKEKQLVRWRVLQDDPKAEDACWKDGSLFEAYIRFYGAKQAEEEKALCMVTGQWDTPAKQHPKGIVAINGNAKLISANDSSGFTYRGRFREDWQSATVSYEASQKAHSGLRWVVVNQGVILGGRTFVCWNPQGIALPRLTGPFCPGGDEPSRKPSDYQDKLKETLKGWKDSLPDKDAKAVIAAFDAATAGRLAVTYYNELQASDFVQRLHDWDASCCWYFGKLGVQSPALYQIVSFAFGNQRVEKGAAKMVVDDRVMRQQIQRLIACRVDGAKMPLDIERALVNRAGNLGLYGADEKGGYLREALLSTACAVVKKYHHDFGEELEMALDPKKQDVSYQYGRLLAVLEKVEQDTYDDSERRETNAIRMQPAFVKRPQYASRVIWEQLERAYFPRLKVNKPYFYTKYHKLIGEIMEQISAFPEADQKKALGDTYLMGYYLQRNELYKSKNQETEE